MSLFRIRGPRNGIVGKRCAYAPASLFERPP